MKKILAVSGAILLLFSVLTFVQANIIYYPRHKKHSTFQTQDEKTKDLQSSISKADPDYKRSSVPISPEAWLFSAGIIGLIGIRRKLL